MVLADSERYRSAAYRPSSRRAITQRPGSAIQSVDSILNVVDFGGMHQTKDDEQRAQRT